MRVILTIYADDSLEKIVRTIGPIEGEEAINDAMQEIADNNPRTTHIGVTRLDMVCDFCSAPDPVSMFRTEAGKEIRTQIQPERVDTHMDGDGLWAACPTCEKMVLARDLIGLAAHSFDCFKEIHAGVPDDMGAFAVSKAHALFWSGWDGKKPTRIPQDSEIMDERKPVDFCFRAYDISDADSEKVKLLGGGRYDAFFDDEAAHEAAAKHFQEHYPTADIHIEQISAEEYAGEHS